MKTRIAILLNGGPADQEASVYAVQLAARKKGRLYAIQDCKFDKSDKIRKFTPIEAAENEQRILKSFRTVTAIARSERVEISCHFLGNYLMGCFEKGQPEVFLSSHAINCLVVSSWPEEIQDRRQAWLNGLQERFYFMHRQSFSNFQVIMPPS